PPFLRFLRGLARRCGARLAADAPVATGRGPPPPPAAPHARRPRAGGGEDRLPGGRERIGVGRPRPLPPSWSHTLGFGADRPSSVDRTDRTSGRTPWRGSFVSSVSTFVCFGIHFVGRAARSPALWPSFRRGQRAHVAVVDQQPQTRSQVVHGREEPAL